MEDIPFNEGTQIYQIFQILSDGQWHCGKHELPGTQPAKPIQIIKQNGYEVEMDRFLCQTCGYKTVHRKLVSTTPTGDVVIRSALPGKLRRRVKELYNNTEAITQRTDHSEPLEIDHRFPQVRWSGPEGRHDPNMPDKEIFEKFQLLTRQNNLWKSRYCENCEKTGKRGTFIVIEYFYQGSPTWPEYIAADDERGCHGCFWYNPDKWRQSLNELIARNQ